MDQIASQIANLLIEKHRYDYDDAWAAALSTDGRNLPADAQKLHRRRINQAKKAQDKREKEQAKLQAKAQAARRRIESGKHTNADLDLVVEAGLAYRVGDRADEFSGAGIVFHENSGNPYADNFEEAFVTRGK